ncbi:MAG: phosphoribosylglycinamide formyltransferase [Betaproteobacteria bacterium]|nr:phosphoribosylglycinamide formyltransferase [Betaproteobacteria bacterium]
MSRVVVLVSGRGSNMQALLEAGIPLAAVISNRPAARGLDIARSHGVATAVVDHREHPDRESFDRALAARIDTFQPDLVVLAGFMRILTPTFTRAFAGRLVNIHPSLLPAFAGLDTHRRALEAGVRIHGCTVHFVTEELDHGPVIAQAAVPVHEHDTEDELAARVLAQEHRILPAAVNWFLAGRLRVNGMRVSLVDENMTETALRVPETS